MTNILINLAVEDDLSEAVLKAILNQSNLPFLVGQCLKKNGNGYIKKILPGLKHAAQISPYLVLTDLDNNECPLSLLTKWLPQPKHPNLIFRVAVIEVEAWLLAHRDAFAQFLGISVDLIPYDVDAIPDPKRFLIELTKKSKKRHLKAAIVPTKNSTAKVGKDYNSSLIQFVDQDWHAELAKPHSQSLRRAVNAIDNFKPSY
jgi:hypothetical protein